MAERDDYTAHLAIIDKIYAAALDDSWQAVVDSLSAHFDESPIQIFGHDLALGKADLFFTANHGEERLRQYADYYHEINPWVPGILSAAPGQVCSVEDYLPQRELVRTEFYNDWLRPHDDISGGGGALLHASEDRSLIIGGSLRSRDREDRETEMMDLFEVLIPHLYRALDIQRGLRGANLIRDHLDTALGALASGTLLLDAQGRIIYANDRASASLARSDLLYRNQFGEVHAYDPAADSAIQQSLSVVTSATVEAGRHLFSIRTKDEKDTYYGMLAPVRQSPDALPFSMIGGREPAALFIIVAPRNDDASLVTALKKVLGFTPAEATVAVALYHGDSPREYAEQNEVSVHTVRNQVKSAMAKTGAHRQGDLVRQVARVAQLVG